MSHDQSKFELVRELSVTNKAFSLISQMGLPQPHSVTVKIIDDYTVHVSFDEMSIASDFRYNFDLEIVDAYTAVVSIHPNIIYLAYEEYEHVMLVWEDGSTSSGRIQYLSGPADNPTLIRVEQTSVIRIPTDVIQQSVVDGVLTLKVPAHVAKPEMYP